MSGQIVNAAPGYYGTPTFSISLHYVEVRCKPTNRDCLSSYDDGRQVYLLNKEKIDAAVLDPNVEINFRFENSVTIDSPAALEGLIGDHLHDIPVEQRSKRLKFLFMTLTGNAREFMGSPYPGRGLSTVKFIID